MKKEIVAFTFAVASSAALAAIEMGAPFSDGAVLQRGMKVPVWGTATAGNEIEVSFAGKSLETTVSQDGSWRVDLPSMDACSKGREMVVVERESGWFGSKVDEKVLTDILVGEWVIVGTVPDAYLQSDVFGNKADLSP